MAGLRTQLLDLLGIELPIVQAPIGSATCPRLAAAVSNAGALGMLALSWTDPKSVRSAIWETKALTDRPFGVNLVLKWSQEERLAICLEEKVPVISFAWGDPDPYLPAIHNVGAKVLQSVGSAAEARRAADLGVDIVVAQGWEAGGHVLGEVTTMALLPRVVDTVAPLPVLAAGGVADGRGIAAALALGAAGVWIGTKFLVSEEALTHNKYREAILKATEADTRFTMAFDGGWPDAHHRVITNTTCKDWESAGSPPAGRRPGEGEVVAHFADGRPVYLYDDVIPLSGMTGEVERLAMYSGQSVGLVKEIRSAASIVHSLAEETYLAIRKLARIVDSE